MSRSKHDILDLSEFVTLLTDHQALLRGYIRTLIPNASDIRDVVQNTNLFLWEHREDFEPGTSFKAWAFSVARFRSMDHRKKMKKEHCLVFDDKLIDLIAQVPDGLDIEASECQHWALDKCLSELKPKDQKLITARYTNRVPLEAYARHDGRSPGSLRVILNRLRLALRQCIDKKLAVEGGIQ